MKILEHEMKNWEIKYGYLSIKVHSEWREFFKPVINRNFTLNVLGEELYERKIDDQGRIYVGSSSLNILKTDEIVLIVRDEKGNFCVKKEG